MDLREEWKCDEHENGACYKKEDEHFPLNRWKVKHWAAAIVSQPFLLVLKLILIF